MSTSAAPTEDVFHDLARSSQRAWSTVEFEHTRAGRETVHAWIRRPFDLRVETSTGEVIVEHVGSTTSSRLFAWEPGGPAAEPHPGIAPEEPPSPGAEQRADGSWMEGDPMYENYQWVAMLHPTELADGQFYDEDLAEQPVPLGTTITRVYSADRFGRATWWAELSPAEGSYNPRCSCCPLLYGRESHLVEALAGNTRPLRDQAEADFFYTSRFLVALDLQTGICVSVDHLDGSEPGEAFSVRILASNEPMSDELFAKPPVLRRFAARTRESVQNARMRRG